VSNILQQSISRGSFRSPITTVSTADVATVVRRVRPNPISVVWDFSGANVNPNGSAINPGNTPPDVNTILATLSTTGPGTLYISGPSPSQVNIGIGTTQLWLNTGVTQAAGVGTWALIFSQTTATAGGSGGSGDGAGGGDGGGGE
jgi:hypothetical protein